MRSFGRSPHKRSCTRVSAHIASPTRFSNSGRYCNVLRGSIRNRSVQMASLSSTVSVDWLASNISREDVRVLDATWFLPVMGRSAFEEFQTKRIPGSKFFDIDGVANLESGFPHMLPSAAAFAAAADALDVGPDTTVIIYDRIGTFSCPRAWWTWKVFGHDKVAVLEGGLPAWEAKGLDLETSPLPDDAVRVASVAAQAPSGQPRYPAQLRPGAVYSMQEMRDTLQSGSVQVVDARASGRFQGLQPEPRADIPSGHMRGALNVPFMSLLQGDAPTGAFKSKDELRAAFATAGVDLSRPIVCTCGSGSTAAVLVHALDQLGVADVPIYDGSWMEWATTGNEIISEAPKP